MPLLEQGGSPSLRSRLLTPLRRLGGPPRRRGAVAERIRQREARQGGALEVRPAREGLAADHWKIVDDKSAAWKAEQQRIQDEANKARNKATKVQPRADGKLVAGKVDEGRMAFPLLLRGRRCAPLSTGFGRWVRYWWIALRLSTLRLRLGRTRKNASAERVFHRVTRGIP